MCRVLVASTPSCSPDQRLVDEYLDILGCIRTGPWYGFKHKNGNCVARIGIHSYIVMSSRINFKMVLLKMNRPFVLTLYLGICFLYLPRRTRCWAVPQTESYECYKALLVKGQAVCTVGGMK
jgi:hypothetical protein